MDVESEVIWIINTYELHEKLKEKIIRIATRRINEGGSNSFDNRYRMIDRLIEKFQYPFRELNHLRLDTSTKKGVRLHDIIGTNDTNPERILNQKETKEDRLTLDGAIAVLSGEIDELDLKLMNQLLNQDKTTKLNIPPEELLASVPEIRKRLEVLAKIYEKNGRLVIPQRPIVHINFDPFKIKFGQRDYNGDSLAFFRKHQSVYRGMTRSELARFDQGLYLTLRRSGQISKAIPKVKKRPLSPKENIEVLVAYSQFDGNAKKAASHSPYSRETFRRKWKRAGLNAKGRGNLSPNQMNLIIHSYQKYEGNSCEAARHLPYSRSSIRKYWEKAGLSAKGKAGRKRTFSNS